jgi:hypothetical protein
MRVDVTHSTTPHFPPDIMRMELFLAKRPSIGSTHQDSSGLTRLKLDQLQMSHTYLRHSLLEGREQRTATVEREGTSSYRNRILLQRKVSKVK